MVEVGQPLVVALGGGATLGNILWLAREARKDDPQWDHAAAMGTIWGAVGGAALLVVDIARGV